MIQFVKVDCINLNVYSIDINCAFENLFFKQTDYIDFVQILFYTDLSIFLREKIYRYYKIRFFRIRKNIVEQNFFFKFRTGVY